jgi:RimJ/RimL family protein N-acetyltransferase
MVVLPEIQCGYQLMRAAWGRSFASETSRAVLEYGLGTLGLDEIVETRDARTTS